MHLLEGQRVMMGSLRQLHRALLRCLLLAAEVIQCLTKTIPQVLGRTAASDGHGMVICQLHRTGHKEAAAWLMV